MSLRTTFLPIVLLTTACAVDDLELSTTTQAVGCSIVVCTENAASAGDGLLFDEINLEGNRNYAGVKLIGADAPDGSTVTIDIWLDELVAYNSARMYRHADLVNTVMHFQHESGALFDVRVADVNEETALFLSRNEEHQFVPVYHLMARLLADPTKTEFEVCSHDPLTFDPSWTGLGHHALVFRGDKYDPITKEVVSGDLWGKWGFIACNGSAASKLHLWRHTSAGAYDSLWNEAFPTSLTKRTTLLRAITADYCGNGHSFTENGTPLVFATAQDPTSWPFAPRFPTGSIRSVEAMWGPSGATCLDVTRRSYYGGYTRADVERKCHRTFEACPTGGAPFPTGWEYMAHVITANP